MRGEKVHAELVTAKKWVGWMFLSFIFCLLSEVQLYLIESVKRLLQAEALKWITKALQAKIYFEHQEDKLS